MRDASEISFTTKNKADHIGNDYELKNTTKNWFYSCTKRNNDNFWKYRNAILLGTIIVNHCNRFY